MTTPSASPLHRENGNGQFPRNFSLVFDCVGSAASINTAIRVVEKTGKVIVIGQAIAYEAVDMLNVMYKELKIYGSCMQNRKDTETAIGLLARDRINWQNLVSKEFAFSDIQEAFTEITKSGKDYVKCILKH